MLSLPLSSSVVVSLRHRDDTDDEMTSPSTSSPSNLSRTLFDLFAVSLYCRWCLPVYYPLPRPAAPFVALLSLVQVPLASSPSPGYTQYRRGSPGRANKRLLRTPPRSHPQTHATRSHSQPILESVVRGDRLTSTTNRTTSAIVTSARQTRCRPSPCLGSSSSRSWLSQL